MTDFQTLITMDPTLTPLWQGLAEGRVMIQRCTACGAHQFPPRPFCLSCDAEGPEWVAATGRGTIYSLTTSHLPPHAGESIALIELDEGPRLLMQTEGRPPIGEAGTVVRAEGPAGQPVLHFRPHEIGA